jgi:hypothetical protein
MKSEKHLRNCKFINTSKKRTMTHTFFIKNSGRTRKEMKYTTTESESAEKKSPNHYNGRGK